MKKILLATDGSVHARQSAKFFASLPHDEKVEITVVSALYLPVTNQTYLTGDWIRNCIEQDEKQAEQEFEWIKKLYAGANVTLNHVIREGHPGEAIVAVARDIDAELVVLGAKGKSAVNRILLGSTSDYVATHAPCSVLVVRPTEAITKGQPIRIAIGYEESGAAQAAIEEFSEFSWGKEPDVRIVNVSFRFGFFDADYLKLSDQMIKNAADQIRSVAPNATGVHLESDHFGEALVQYAEDEKIDIFVVGETPRTRLGRVLMGSMTRYVLRHAPSGVWITRNRAIHGVQKNSEAKEVASE
ncbi:Putative universal stress protein [Roseimaritima multifibrata]|uniref:Universal stress protein n=1 Tax=Roseimaritima multifibrata TaxID=1930274 RepID=A0A517MGT3_9BACT|nr:universal stress protein [Roseimaritima multifibrata]QDS93977.1 Putative universal stress protein [Roseimaritima multifibrata]